MQLHRQQAALQAVETQVILISFGPAYLAGQWRDQLGLDFPLLLDSERDVYQAYGLTHSLWGGVFAPRLVWRYLKNLELPRIKGNPTQLGGDFVLDAAGRFLFIHLERDATDRPAIEDVLAILREQATS